MLASLLVQKDVGALVFRITSEARVVVHPRETLARAVISFDASTRAFASARLLVSPPGYDGASPSRPDEYLFAVAALASRVAFASIIARRHRVPDAGERHPARHGSER